MFKNFHKVADVVPVRFHFSAVIGRNARVCFLKTFCVEFAEERSRFWLGLLSCLKIIVAIFFRSFFL